MVARGGGSIINIASILGAVGFRSSSAHVAAKHGVVGLTQTAALDTSHSERTKTMTAIKIGIIGNGNVGGALERGLTRARREVRSVGADKQAVRSTAEWADVLILAVPFGAIRDVATTIAPLTHNKVVIDVTNALTPDMTLALGFTTSGAEELQKQLPGANVVKAFNTQFAQHMDSGRIGEQKLVVFAAGDDAAARNVTIEIAKSIGFDAVDAGPLANARLLEPLGYLNIQLGYVLGHGTQIGLTLARGT